LSIFGNWTEGLFLIFLKDKKKNFLENFSEKNFSEIFEKIFFDPRVLIFSEKIFFRLLKKCANKLKLN